MKRSKRKKITRGLYNNLSDFGQLGANLNLMELIAIYKIKDEEYNQNFAIPLDVDIKPKEIMEMIISKLKDIYGDDVKLSAIFALFPHSKQVMPICLSDEFKKEIEKENNL